MSYEDTPSESDLGVYHDDKERMLVNRQIKEGLIKKYPFALEERVLPDTKETVGFFPGLDENLHLEFGEEMLRGRTRVVHSELGVIYETNFDEEIKQAFSDWRYMLLTDQGILILPQNAPKNLFVEEEVIEALILTATTGTMYICSADFEYFPFGMTEFNGEELIKMSTILKTFNKINKKMHTTEARKKNGNKKTIVKEILRKI